LTRWILVRHGESVANAEGWLAGHVDVPLTALGRHQADLLAPRLVSERIVRVVSSDLRRAMDTAKGALAGRAWGLRSVPDLRERYLGAWERLDDAEARRNGARAHLDHVLGRPPGGEALADVALRALAFLDAIDDGLPTLVVAHGGLLRAIVGLERGDVPFARIGKLPMANAKPLVLELPCGRWGEVRRSIPTERLEA
jgi:probable phosphoglycerate mutase